MPLVMLENVSDRDYEITAGKDTLVIPARSAIPIEEDLARLYVPWPRDSECPGNGKEAQDPHIIHAHPRFESAQDYDAYMRSFRHKHGFFGKPQDFATATFPDDHPRAGQLYRPPLRIRPFSAKPVAMGGPAKAGKPTPADGDAEFAGLGRKKGE